MVSDLRSLGFVGADDGHIIKIALPSSFIDNRATACPKLLVQDKVLHPLWKRNERPEVTIKLKLNFKKISLL